MLKNAKKLQAFEAARTRAEKVDVEQNLRILDALYEEAVMRIHVGVIIKNIRVEAIETYRDFKMGDMIPVSHF
jgi:hypothetical protein